MDNLEERGEKVKRGRGAPRKVTQKLEKELISYIIEEVVTNREIPTDKELGKRYSIGERTARGIRLGHGLNRWELKEWISKKGERGADEREGIKIRSGYCGGWMMLPVIIGSGIVEAVGKLKMPSWTKVSSWQLILTMLFWNVLGMGRIYHIEDYRSSSEVGLGLLTGRGKLLSDSSVWNIVHSIEEEASEKFYEETAKGSIDPTDPKSGYRISLDDHVVPSFSKLEPKPLEKTRVPTRGRSYPAVRMYYHYDLEKDRVIGLSVKGARERLSKVLVDLIGHIRGLKRKAGCIKPNKLRVIFDRGGYKGSVFNELMEDEELEFLTLAIAYPNSVRQWEAIPEDEFEEYIPPSPKEKKTAVEDSRYHLADTKTKIKDCLEPIRSIVLRNDKETSPKKRWYVLFTDDETSTACELLEEYPKRQSHENFYRGLKCDLFGDALPKAYHLIREENKDGQMRKTTSTVSSQETKKEISFVGWTKALASNLLKDFSKALGGNYENMYPSTLRRKFLQRPGTIMITNDEVLVTLDPFVNQDGVLSWLEQINKQDMKIPWLANRTLKMNIAEKPPSNGDISVDLRKIFFANFHAHSPP